MHRAVLPECGVIAVHCALEEAFQQCMQKGIGQGVFKEIWREVSVSETELAARMYTKASAFIRTIVAGHMHQISKTAREVLEHWEDD